MILKCYFRFQTKQIFDERMLIPSSRQVNYAVPWDLPPSLGDFSQDALQAARPRPRPGRYMRNAEGAGGAGRGCRERNGPVKTLVKYGASRHSYPAGLGAARSTPPLGSCWPSHRGRSNSKSLKCLYDSRRGSACGSTECGYWAEPTSRVTKNAILTDTRNCSEAGPEARYYDFLF